MPVIATVHVRRRRSRASAANGNSQATYHGKNELEAISSANVAQPVPSIQSSCPRQTLRSNQQV